MKKTAEEILREYITFNDVNQSETVELCPLTIVDAMEEYATQCQNVIAEKKCYHPLPYRLAKSDVNFECTLCGKFI
jgi:hypothetical protein